MIIRINDSEHRIPDIFFKDRCNYRSILELICTTNLALANKEVELFLTYYSPPHARVMIVSDGYVKVDIPWLLDSPFTLSHVKYIDLTLFLPQFEKEGSSGKNGKDGRPGKKGKTGPQGKRGYRGFSGFSL